MYLLPGDLVNWLWYPAGEIEPVVRVAEFLTWRGGVRMWVKWENKRYLVHRNCINVISDNHLFDLYTQSYNDDMSETPIRHIRIPQELVDLWQGYANEVNMNFTQFVIQSVKIGAPYVLHAFSARGADRRKVEDIMGDKNHPDNR